MHAKIAWSLEDIYKYYKEDDSVLFVKYIRKDFISRKVTLTWKSLYGEQAEQRET